MSSVTGCTNDDWVHPVPPMPLPRTHTEYNNGNAIDAEANNSEAHLIPTNAMFRKRHVPLRSLRVKKKPFDRNYYYGTIEDANEHDLRGASYICEGLRLSRADRPGTITGRTTHNGDEPNPSEPFVPPSSADLHSARRRSLRARKTATLAVKIIARLFPHQKLYQCVQKHLECNLSPKAPSAHFPLEFHC